MVPAIFILYSLNFLHVTHGTEEDSCTDIWENKLNMEKNGQFRILQGRTFRDLYFVPRIIRAVKLL
jgi:hypothetical protein